MWEARRGPGGLPPVKGTLTEDMAGVCWACSACSLAGCVWMKVPHQHSTNTSADVLGTLGKGQKGVTCLLLAFEAHFTPLVKCTSYCCLVAQLYLTPCDPMDHSTPGFPRLPCPSLSPKVCSNSCPLSGWSHPTISSSVALFSSCPQSFPASESFPMSLLFARLSRVFSSTTVWKHQFFGGRPSLWFNSPICTWLLEKP